MRGEPVPGSDTWGANLDYTDSPTITYTPVTGEEFATRVMAPISPTTIIYLSQSGWSIDRVLECCVQQINDVANTPTHEVQQGEPPNPARFGRGASEKGADVGYLRFGVEYASGEAGACLYIAQVPGALANEEKELKSLLGLPEESKNKYRLTGNPVRSGPDEVAMQTRSLYATMYALAQQVPVPSEHVRTNQTSTRPCEAGQENAAKWLCIEHSRLPQVDPFVQVFYNGYWFYINKSDWSSKRTFSLLTYLFSLQSAAKGQTGPLLTVPAGR